MMWMERSLSIAVLTEDGSYSVNPWASSTGWEGYLRLRSIVDSLSSRVMEMSHLIYECRCGLMWLALSGRLMSAGGLVFEG